MLFSRVMVGSHWKKYLWIGVLLYAMIWALFGIHHKTEIGNFKGEIFTSEAAIQVLNQLQSNLSACMVVKGKGLRTTVIDHCLLKVSHISHGFKDNEFDICKTILLWEQFRNLTTVLTREYLDAQLNRWGEVAAERISRLGYKKCYPVAHCEEYLDMIVPSRSPFVPRQYRTCAVVGNSMELLKSNFGKEIDQHTTVIRINDAPVNETYSSFVGLKRDFRIVDGRTARNMIAILNGSDDEVLIMHSSTHGDFNPMIKAIRNPVFLFLGIVPGNNAKGTMLKAVEFATSVCEIVDVYGYSFDPSNTKGFPYFSSLRRLRTNPREQIYYRLLDCLGVIRMNTPDMRKSNNTSFNWRNLVRNAYEAASWMRRSERGFGPFRNCGRWSNGSSINESSFSRIRSIRKDINLSKIEVNISKEAAYRYSQREKVSLYRNNTNNLNDLLCLRHSN